MATLSLVLVAVSVYKFSAWGFVLVLPLCVLLRHLCTRMGESRQVDLSEVTAWWWLPTHVVLSQGFRRTTIRRSEVSAVKYAKLRRQLLSIDNRL